MVSRVRIPYPLEYSTKILLNFIESVFKCRGCNKCKLTDERKQSNLEEKIPELLDLYRSCYGREWGRVHRKGRPQVEKLRLAGEEDPKVPKKGATEIREEMRKELPQEQDRGPGRPPNCPQGSSLKARSMRREEPPEGWVRVWTFRSSESTWNLLVSIRNH